MKNKFVLAIMMAAILLINSLAAAQVILLPVKNANKIFLDDGSSVQKGINTNIQSILNLNQLVNQKADKSYVDSNFAQTAEVAVIKCGSGVFNSLTGTTILFSTPMPDTTYRIFISSENDTQFDIGAVSFKEKSVNGFKIINSGENTTTNFDFIAVKK